jgi:hypothetical protein
MTPIQRALGFVLASLAFAMGVAGASSCASTPGHTLPMPGEASLDAPNLSDNDFADLDQGKAVDVGVDSRMPGPTLAALGVSATGASDGGAIGLVPAFSPTVYDYYVQCAAGSNALTVSMTASKGAKSVLIEPVATDAAPTQTLPLDVEEGQAIVAGATDGRTTVAYWVRCLPHDFPPMALVKHPEAGTPTPGYYLLGNMNVAAGGYAMVLDGNGVPVWYTPAPPGQGVENVDTVVDGSISFIPLVDYYVYQLHQLNPTKTTYLAPAGPQYSYPTGLYENQHELRVLPNGNFLVFSFPPLPGYDLTGLEMPLPDGGSQALGPGATIMECAILEFAPDGQVKWTWKATEHFDPVRDTAYPQPGRNLPDGGVSIDVFHCNSMDVDPANDDLLVSSRMMDSVFYVERPSGRVVWKMGGKEANMDGAIYVPVTSPFHRQHDARLQPGWSSACPGGGGQISLFDDETAEPGPARAVLYDVALDTGCDGGKTTPAKVAWQYPGTAISAASGGFRISADGSRVVDWGYNRVPNIVFTELDVAGNDLMDFYFTAGNVSYRTVKVPLTTFDLRVLRRTAGL